MSHNEFDWIENIYNNINKSLIDNAIDILFKNMNDYFCNGEFEIADEALNIIDINKLDSNLVIGVLSITFAARNHLKNRDAFYKNAVRYYLKRKESKDRIRRLLVGLR